jgi:N-acylneuraminate cytidylyltransferase
MKRKIISFIPARRDSKEIPNKNITLLNNKPLINYVIDALWKNMDIDEVIVATNSKDIIKVVQNRYDNLVDIYLRKEENAQDNSPTEDVILEFLDYRKDLQDNDIFILVQCTNPFLKEEYIKEVLDIFIKNTTYESMLSVIEFPRFVWANDKPLNYDINNRKRRQDFTEKDKVYVENGSFYINTIGNIKKYKNRLSYPIGKYIMPYYSIIEIDTMLDLKISEILLNNL